MMATEATSETLAKSSSIPDHELNTTETSSQDVSPTEQIIVNEIPGTDKDENKPTTYNAEASVNSAEVSVSGGSDTEASKAETSKNPSGHLRTSSTVKKPLSFKTVSVNKTFLASKGATPIPASKLGEKGAAGAAATPSGQLSSSAPRPRLVAKTGSGLRDSVPRNAASANGSKAGAAPDASAVWNKNRPAAPAEPKRLTDEELKQRYGIHLATRLESDAPGNKEKTWADIDDDDDDDWAPETIEWTDGTKITVPTADETPIPPPELSREPLPILKDYQPAEVAPPTSKSPVPTQATPVVKPSAFGSGRAGLVLKGAVEKPTLVAKPPGPPTPVKSPWASLPPVEKLAPVAIEIPQSQPPPSSRFGQRDPHGFQALPPPPAKEIAADDFSRSSWREGNANTSRELYNSQSGRYEPVNEGGRRSSNRNDARQPAVLQRPQHDGPAEPSAAFQTHRAGGQDPSYGRRRTSSNVSGGSGNFGRRMSRSGHEMPPNDLLNMRRGSLAAVSDAPSSPGEFSPTGQHPNQHGPQSQNQPWQRASPAVSHPSPQSAHGQPVTSVSDSVDGGQPAPANAALSEEQIFEEQKKRMQRSREEAIKRRKEEEAKEEAAKRERIRIKLEAMGPPPETQKSKVVTPKAEKVTPVSIQSREPANSEVEPSKAAEESGVPKVNTSESAVEVVPAPNADLKAEKSSTEPQPRANGIDNGGSVKSPPTNLRQGQDRRSSQTWVPSSDRYQSHGPWAQPTQQSSRSVWGPPTNDRTLGNGTFNPELSRLPNMHSSHPGPIGPPSQNRNNQYPRGPGRDPFATKPAPIGPPNRYVDSELEEQRRTVAAQGWGKAAELVAQSDAVSRQKHEAEAALRKEQEAQGIVPQGPVFKETWREVKLDENMERTGPVEPAQRAKAPAPVQQQQQYNSDVWQPGNAPPGPRGGSRFFPKNTDIRIEEQQGPDRPGSPSPPPPTTADHPAYDGDVAHPHVSLPRPAPVVKLPPISLPPVAPVALPPTKPSSWVDAATRAVTPVIPLNINPHQGHSDYNSRVSSNTQDARRTEPPPNQWQDRINNLIHRKHSPPKAAHLFAVDSSSKNALELAHTQSAATVSLPSLTFGVALPDNGDIFSKPAAEECFEEQEMGSLPVIKVPHTAPAAAWSPASPPPKTLPRKFHAQDVVSHDALDFPDTISHGRFTFRVQLPGHEWKVVNNGPLVPAYRQRSNPRRGGAHGGTRGGAGSASRQGSSSTPRGGRPKDNNFGSPNNDNNSTPPISTHPGRGGPSHRGGNRGGRGFESNNWNRHVSTPVQI